MKNKSGFTLVELLAVITILSVILVIGVPTLLKSLSGRKSEALEKTYNVIETAALNYTYDYSLEKPAIVCIEDLCDKYLDCPVISPTTKEELTGCVFVNEDIVYTDEIEVSLDVQPNGGILSQQFNDKYEPGYKIELKEPTKEGYDFAGWKVVKGNSVIKENTLTIGTTDTIIYALWNEDSILTIDLDGGSVSESQEGTYKIGAVIELIAPTKEGYTFSYWKLVSGIESGVISGNTFTMGSGSAEIKAVYTKRIYQISYELNGGIFEDNYPTSGEYGSTVELSYPIKEGYIFNGWSLNGEILEEDFLTVGLENILLTALWEENGATYITNLLNNESTLNNGLKQTTATISGNTVDSGIRYVGATPNNKVYFNCKDKDSNNVNYGNDGYSYASSCETWRIIGVFNTKTSASDTTGAKRVKIVRDAFSVNMSWDSSSKGGGTANNSGWGINEWGEADLQTMLNGYYIGTAGEECRYCTDLNQGTCSNDCTSSVTPLSSTSVNMVDSVLWNTGATTFAATLPLLTMYTGERGTQNGKICSSTSTNSDGVYMCTDTVERTMTWEGKIGLIYPSDYAYASTNASCLNDIYGSDSTCNVNNWLHPSSGNYWTISPDASTVGAFYVWRVSHDYRVYDTRAYFAHAVRPSLYLSPNVKITGGNGAEQPYRLGS